MMIISNPMKCSGCHACYSSCPEKCIEMRVDSEGFLYPYANSEKCIDCGICESVCPFLTEKTYTKVDSAWAANCIDDGLRLNSSSGGVFSLLAQKVLTQNGIIYGAAFSDDFKSVVHIGIELSGDLKKIRTSKYVQSVVGDVFREVKANLEHDRKVLFSGVPCQISGLRKYLGKEYQNLVCVDVICHGVPSPLVWKKYLESIEKANTGIIQNINFRHKKTSWQKFGINRTENGVEIFNSKDTDPYMQLFLKDYSLRPSCYDCQLKKNGSEADITLGDFWGIENVAPELNDGKGTSAVVINTEKGRQLFELLSNEVIRTEVDFDEIKKYNSALYQSVSMPAERDSFFEDVVTCDFDTLASKYCNNKEMKSLRQRLSSTVIWKRIRSMLSEANQKGGVLTEYGLYVKVRK